MVRVRAYSLELPEVLVSRCPRGVALPNQWVGCDVGHIKVVDVH